MNIKIIRYTKFLNQAHSQPLPTTHLQQGSAWHGALFFPEHPQFEVVGQIELPEENPLSFAHEKNKIEKNRMITFIDNFICFYLIVFQISSKLLASPINKGVKSVFVFEVINFLFGISRIATLTPSIISFL